MEIILAKNSGFCFGVKEAINKTYETIERYQDTDKKIYTYGPLIHNKQVTDELEKRGVCSTESLDDVEEGSIIIIRSHGASKSFYEDAKVKDIQIIDATCKYVQKVQETVKNSYEKGYNVVIIGDKNHPEVIGINGWCDDNAIIIESIDDAEKINLDNISIVAQTTITNNMWDDVIEVFEKKQLNIDKNNTICYATALRQLSCEQTAQEVDAMIIVGGKHSSNSQKMFAISKKYCKNTYFIETKSDLPLNDLKKYNKIGIAAGASTPEWIIKEVITNMSELSFHGETEETKESASENQMYDLMEEIEKSLRIPGRGEIVKGTIIQVRDNEIVVNLGCKKDGIIPKDEISTNLTSPLKTMFSAGDEIEAQVLKTDDGEGNLLLSRKRLSSSEDWNDIAESFKNKSLIEVKVKNKVKGGVIASFKEITGFIPISQLADKYVENIDEYVGKVLPVKITQLDRKKNKVIFSHRIYLEEEKAKNVEKIWNNISEGDIAEGKVMRFTDYGAFVDIGGIDGLLHISEISWGKISHPSDRLKIGEKIKVKILSMDKESAKVSLGLKQTTEEPWRVLESKYNVGDIIEGKVVQIKEYGLFVEIEPGMDGLVHISEIAHKHVTNPANEVKIGEMVKVKILEIDKEKKRISLSIKETIEKPQEEIPVEIPAVENNEDNEITEENVKQTEQENKVANNISDDTISENTEQTEE